jgi:hypothetical protein
MEVNFILVYKPFKYIPQLADLPLVHLGEISKEDIRAQYLSEIGLVQPNILD